VPIKDVRVLCYDIYAAASRFCALLLEAQTSEVMLLICQLIICGRRVSTSRR
jgi:hypothetical protein